MPIFVLIVCFASFTPAEILFCSVLLLHYSYFYVFLFRFLVKPSVTNLSMERDGGEIRFNVEASGSNMKYNWSKNNVPLDGMENITIQEESLTFHR